MKIQVALLALGLIAVAVARPSDDIVDFETDIMDVEQEGTAGKSVNGEYSWVAPNGEEYSVKYIADHLGFRVLDTDNIAAFRSADEVAAPEEDDESPSEREADEQEEDEEEDDK